MGQIKLLPEDLINKIAAGEVVERPASALKELIENSIDAGADQIHIETERGGKYLIRVADNGAGMSPEDAELALERHATSKIKSIDDLFKISTMGFRGEALPSIASVSKFTLITRTRDSDAAVKITVNGGKDKVVTTASRAPGTTVEVKDLFFNVPGRRKFLKSDSTEFAHISETVSRIALAHPHIRFQLLHNGRKYLNAPKTDSLKERAISILGREIGEDLYPFRAVKPNFKLRGLFSSPNNTTKGTKGIYIFVNNRFVKDRNLSHACQEAYRAIIEKGRYPYVILFIDIDPELVDVNVHPQKIEVRFHNQSEIFATLLNALRAGIAHTPWLHAKSPGKKLFPPTAGELPPPPQSTESAATPESSVPSISSGQFAPPPTPPENWSPPRQSPDVSKNSIEPAHLKAENYPTYPNQRKAPYAAYPTGEMPEPPQRRPPSAKLGVDFIPGWDPTPPPDNSTPPGSSSAPTGEVSPPTGETATIPKSGERAEPTPFPPLQSPPTQPLPAEQRELSHTGEKGFFSQLHYIGQFAEMYLIFSSPDGEKLILIDQHAAHERISYQRLLREFERGKIASQGYLTPQTIELPLSKAQLMEQHLEEFRKLGFVIEPFGTKTFAIKEAPVHLRGDIKGLVLDILEDLARGDGRETLRDQRDNLLMKMACHSSIRGRHRLTPDEVRELLRQLDEIEFGTHCPHGRPLYTEFTKKELEKRFHRT